MNFLIKSMIKAIQWMLTHSFSALTLPLHQLLGFLKPFLIMPKENLAKRE